LPPTDPPPSNPPITEPNPAPQLITESIALPAAGDVHVFAGATAQNFGDATTLLVRNHTSTNSAKALLRFDPAGVEGEIVSATIKLQVVNASGPMALALSPAGNDTWHESYVRWSTKPAERAEIARAIANQGQSIAFDVTNLTREAAASDARLSLWVHAPTLSSDFVELASREHPSEAYRPVLEIVVRRPAPAPPASAPLEPEGEGPVALDAGLLALVGPTASRPLSLSDYLAVRRLTDDLPAQSLFGPLPLTGAPASSLPAAGRRSWSIAEAGDLVYRGRPLTAAQLLPAAIDAALGGYADPESDLLDPEASTAAE
jgi:hypothetical protein